MGLGQQESSPVLRQHLLTWQKQGAGTAGGRMGTDLSCYMGAEMWGEELGPGAPGLLPGACHWCRETGPGPRSKPWRCARLWQQGASLTSLLCGARPPSPPAGSQAPWKAAPSLQQSALGGSPVIPACPRGLRELWVRRGCGAGSMHGLEWHGAAWPGMALCAGEPWQAGAFDAQAMTSPAGMWECRATVLHRGGMGLCTAWATCSLGTGWDGPSRAALCARGSSGSLAALGDVEGLPAVPMHHLEGQGLNFLVSRVRAWGSPEPDLWPDGPQLTWLCLLQGQTWGLDPPETWPDSHLKLKRESVSTARGPEPPL